MADLKDRLRELRKKYKLTQKDVGMFLGVSESAYGYYEQGRNEPSIESIRRLSNKYGVSPAYILGETSNPTNNELNKNTEETYDPISYLNEHFEKLGVKDAGFYDYEKWKHLNREEVEDVIKHFEFVLHKAEQRKKGK
ncbi:helix-turn-helix domain-containing protein [Anaerobacillus isosaccharinicus]|uniref:Helix-turn-helix transcriptional regulator n=1 Tax=Anaerobacillus isosaccharinicus TaxID=1532552 RepID=A0A1S2MDU5_9BACI|nr:helix-turn-helix transcriptional regulator [Anaerobacillus isosaccharinicus]MBA5588583.1 helix-turn-helix transcriptional regulator [Anaerobacillus isosaccharinicus]QOY38003.1 helix-turn-helix transcriptional regulator [Anaerobacillus isosaccharinicus]